jgi:hypothetical protein
MSRVSTTNAAARLNGKKVVGTDSFEPLDTPTGREFFECAAH